MSRRNGSSNPEAGVATSAAVGTFAAANGTPTAPLGRASWSGFLRWSLVVVPVKAYPAVSSSESISFNQLHADCGQRIQYHKVCPLHGKVDAAAIARGYQYAPDQYVVVETAELDNLRPAKDQGLLLEQCLDAGHIEPTRFSGRSLYLVPEGLPAQRPYLVLHQALHHRGKVALGRIVLSGHRHVALVRPSGRLLSMHLLHDPAQVRSAATWEGLLRDGAASPEEQQLAAMLIDSSTAALDWSKYRDDTAEKLSALIEAKIAGRQWVAPAEEPVQVLQLLDALKQSVAAVGEKTRKVQGKTRKQPLLSQGRSA
jgi:DNA end-binding protein Ku